MDPQGAAIAQLFEAIDRRSHATTVGDADAVRRADDDVGQGVARLAAVAAVPLVDRIDTPPPKPVAVAMAQALFATAHISRTLAVETQVAEPGGFRACPPLAEALGLTMPELEELRDAIDLRVSALLRQVRVLNWLWSRSGDPATHPGRLYHTLFPVEGGAPPLQFIRRGCRLYAVFRGDDGLPIEALYLRWLKAREGAAWPDDTFQGRYVEESTLQAIAQGVGGTPEEIRRLLDNMVCAVPSTDTGAWIRRDRWRHEGWADLTRLGTAADSPAWLTLPLSADALDGESWLEVNADGIVVKAPRKLFDRHALARITAVTHGTYAEMCARMISKDPTEAWRPGLTFDLGSAFFRVLRPLIDWAGSPAVHHHVADRLQTPVEAVERALGQARDVWIKSAQQGWCGGPTPERPITVQTLLVTHLASMQASMQRLWRKPQHPRAPHQRVLPLFCAFYVQSAAVSRLWRSDDGAVPGTEDVAATWFWGTWRRVLEAMQFDEP